MSLPLSLFLNKYIPIHRSHSIWRVSTHFPSFHDNPHELNLDRFILLQSIESDDSIYTIFMYDLLRGRVIWSRPTSSLITDIEFLSENNRIFKFEFKHIREESHFNSNFNKNEGNANWTAPGLWLVPIHYNEKRMFVAVPHNDHSPLFHGHLPSSFPGIGNHQTRKLPHPDDNSHGMRGYKRTDDEGIDLIEEDPDCADIFEDQDDLTEEEREQLRISRAIDCSLNKNEPRYVHLKSESWPLYARVQRKNHESKGTHRQMMLPSPSDVRQNARESRYIHALPVSPPSIYPRSNQKQSSLFSFS